MDRNETEERFIALESLCAEYERTIKDLNEIVAQQALKLDRLEKEVFYLIQNFDTSGQIRPLSEETPPPHY